MKLIAKITMLIAAVLLLTACNKMKSDTYTEPPEEPIAVATYENENENENKVETLTIVAPFIPWEMPWVKGEVFPQGSQILPASLFNQELRINVQPDGHVNVTGWTVSQIGTNTPYEQRPVSYIIKVVNSITDVPFMPGIINAVTDGTLVFVIRDEIGDRAGDNVSATRKIEFLDLNELTQRYGDVHISLHGMLDGGNFIIMDHDVVRPHEYLTQNLAKISDITLDGNYSDSVTVSATVALTIAQFSIPDANEDGVIEYRVLDPIEWSNELGVRIGADVFTS